MSEDASCNIYAFYLLRKIDILNIYFFLRKDFNISFNDLISKYIWIQCTLAYCGVPLV